MSFSTRKRDLFQLLWIIALVIAVNFASSAKFFRIDLTSEKKYTLAKVTRSFLRNVNQEILVKVYLTGDLNVGFNKLSRATRETLTEFRIISNGDFRFEFVDPLESAEDLEELKEFGLQPVPVFEATADGRKIQSNVYPYALMSFSGYQVAINLLENLPGLSGAENLNISMESLEYKITDAMRRLVIDEVPAVAFLEGHGELDELDVFDITNALSHYYQVDRGSLTDDAYILDNYDALIIAKPQQPFSQKDKFIIDQYIMRGGKVLWLVDAVNVTLDSLRRTTQTVGLARDINLNDQLFRYGVRINHELVQDVQAALIPINAAPAGEQPRIVPVPWMFNPLLNTSLNHPVTRNVNVVRSEFVSSVDTVGQNPNVTKDILLRTGRYSRIVPVPAFISLALVNEPINRDEFLRSNIPVAVSLEGEFQSAFTNRPTPPQVNINSSDIRYTSKPTRMIVVADGDIIRNEVRLRHGGSPQPVPLGFDEMSNQTFGNKQFIVNAVNYLIDDEGWMSLRNRSHELRLLDREKLSSDVTFWKLINVVVPLFFILLLAIIIPLWRRYRYAKR